MKKLLILLLILVMIAALFTACVKGPKELQATKEATTEEVVVTEEEPMSDMVVYDLDGNPVDLVGERTYLKAWASWCSYCITGMPELEELFAQDHDFRLMTIVAPGYNGELDEEEFKAWFKERDYKIDVYIDKDGSVMKQLGVRGYPSSFYLDETGTLFDVRIGHNDNEYIKATMAQ